MQHANDNFALHQPGNKPPENFRQQLDQGIGMLAPPLIQGRFITMGEHLNHGLKKRGGIMAVDALIEEYRDLERDKASTPERLFKALEIMGDQVLAKEFVVIRDLRNTAFQLAAHMVVKSSEKCLVEKEGVMAPFHWAFDLPGNLQSKQEELIELLVNDGGLGRKQAELQVGRFQQNVRDFVGAGLGFDQGRG